MHNLELMGLINIALLCDAALSIGNVERACGQEPAERTFKESEEPFFDSENSYAWNA